MTPYHLWPPTGTSGIYAIILNAKDRWYVGSAVDIRQRWHTHLSCLRRGVHANHKLQNAWSKHGADAFELRVLERVANVQDLIAIEQRYLDTLRPHYNICRTAGNKLGVPLPADAVEAMRRKLTGLKRSAETRERQRQSQLGRTFSEETLAKMRAAHQNISAESRAKMSAAKKGVYPAKAGAASRLASLGKPRPDVAARNRARAGKGVKRPDLAARNRRRVRLSSFTQPSLFE